MKNPFFILFLLLCIGLITYCAKEPATRSVQIHDENSQLCKSSYLSCRSGCYNVDSKGDRIDCLEKCERDLDICLGYTVPK